MNGYIFQKKLLFLLLIIPVFTACTAHFREFERAKGVYHYVKSGETLWRIARAYDVDIQDLAEINNLTDPGLIKADSVVFVPGANQVVDINSYVKTPKTSVVKIKKSPLKRGVRGEAGYKVKQERLRFDKKRFIWPVKGKVISKFGIQPDGIKYNGINIAAREGTPVVAAASGTVIHSAQLRYYGNTIIIKHGNRYATVYAHLKDSKVKAGDRIEKGKKIALLEKPKNNNTNSYLHFEIRHSNKARNPLFFLPDGK